MGIRLSDHFTYKKLLRFVLPSIAMMVFISVYGVVDGFFVSNFAGKTSFAAINLVMPFVMLLGGIGFMVGRRCPPEYHHRHQNRPRRPGGHAAAPGAKP